MSALDDPKDTYVAAMARGWCEVIPSIPFVQFRTGWEVQIIPPFAGADARFRVRKGSAEVSVYLDLHENLGFFGGPYWEVYPGVDGDVARCAMTSGGELIATIAASLSKQNRMNAARAQGGAA